jgi:hypothetical protein
MEIEVTVAPAGFHIDHPELHHYTSIEGMEAILSSGAFWATHFQSLNDSSELLHLQPKLTAALASAIVPIIVRLGKLIPRILVESRLAGGPILYGRRHAETLIDSFYRVAFTGQGVRPMAVPFIASLCSHAADQPYERCNGLLSQWRGYGQSGGCCIVLDTKDLIELLLCEWDSFYWIGLGIDKVTYDTPEMSVATQFPALISELSDLINQGLRTPITWTPASSGAIKTFLDASTRFKHQGFKEEREVRIVAIPGSAETADAVSREHVEFKSPSIKAVHESNTHNRGRPFIRLFGSAQMKLPVRRILVGPSRRQDENLRRAKVAAGGRFPVAPSQTPYLE